MGVGGTDILATGFSQTTSFSSPQLPPNPLKLLRILKIKAGKAG